MKLKFAVAAVLTAASSLALAQQYVCTVYCLNPSGQTQVVVPASSASEAAQKVDKQSDKICQNAGHGKSTSMTMSASQCSRK
jgi:hypothetical protein